MGTRWKIETGGPCHVPDPTQTVTLPDVGKAPVGGVEEIVRRQVRGCVGKVSLHKRLLVRRAGSESRETSATADQGQAHLRSGCDLK